MRLAFGAQLAIITDTTFNGVGDCNNIPTATAQRMELSKIYEKN